MADLGTMSAPDGWTVTDAGERPPPRSIRPRRGLPSGRALVGGFLIAVAATGIFAAYTSATAGPRTRYVVAGQDIPVGTHLTGTELKSLPVDLPPELARRAVPESRSRELHGLVTLGPLRTGELVQESGVVNPGGAPATEKISFPVARSRALVSSIRPGERVDVVATYGASGSEPYTSFVVRGALVAAVAEGGGGLGEESIVVTLAVHDPRSVLAVAHAVNTAEVFVTRATGVDTAARPAPYRSRPAG